MNSKHVPLKPRMDNFWDKRTAVIFSTFGLVGFGAIVGATTVYYFYIRHKIADHFKIQTSLSSELSQLRKDVDELKTTFGTLDANQAKSKRLKFNKLESRQTAESRRELCFNYLSEDDEFYITASSDSENEGSINESYTGECKGDGGDAITKIENQKFFQSIDKLLDGVTKDQQSAYDTLKLKQQNFQNSSCFWWRFAKAAHLLSRVAEQNGDKELRKSLIQAACAYGEKALKFDDKEADAHKWFAIAKGSMGEFLGVNEKIKNGYIFKEHVDKAISLNPNDHSLYHLLGRFCFEVSQLSWIERRVAATLFSEPPSSTPKEALAHFLKADKLGKPFKENQLYIAKCFIDMKDYKAAAKWLESASKLPIINGSDKTNQSVVLELLSKYRSYLA